METTRVTALIRTHNRPEYFKRCIESVKSQTHPTAALISIDDYDDFHEYVSPYILFEGPTWPSFVCLSTKHEESKSPFFYNLYCNDLMGFLIDVEYNGWFFFLDDDDFLVDNTAIERIIPYLTDPTKVVICQMQREMGRKKKPSDKEITAKTFTKGRIGMPCIFVHSSLKDSVMFDDTEDADYNYIKAMVDKHGATFANEVVVFSPKRNFGK